MVVKNGGDNNITVEGVADGQGRFHIPLRFYAERT